MAKEMIAMLLAGGQGSRLYAYRSMNEIFWYIAFAVPLYQSDPLAF